jgi:predicted transcriptional regulator
MRPAPEADRMPFLFHEAVPHCAQGIVSGSGNQSSRAAARMRGRGLSVLDRVDPGQYTPRGRNHRVTITIELAPEVLARLREKAAREGRDAESVAADLLADALEWEAEDRAQAIEGIRRGLADFEAGRFRSLEEVIARKQRSDA